MSGQTPALGQGGFGLSSVQTYAGSRTRQRGGTHPGAALSVCHHEGPFLRLHSWARCSPCPVNAFWAHSLKKEVAPFVLRPPQMQTKPGF